MNRFEGRLILRQWSTEPNFNRYILKSFLGTHLKTFVVDLPYWKTKEFLDVVSKSSTFQFSVVALIPMEHGRRRTSSILRFLCGFCWSRIIIFSHWKFTGNEFSSETLLPGQEKTVFDTSILLCCSENEWQLGYIQVMRTWARWSHFWGEVWIIEISLFVF